MVPGSPLCVRAGQITITHSQDWLGFSGTFIAGNAVKGQHQPSEETGSGWCKASPHAAGGTGWGTWGTGRSPLYPLLMPTRGGEGWEGSHTDHGEAVGVEIVTAELIQWSSADTILILAISKTTASV